uniref:hypothetical protein n=1 Tax=Cupriavidus necator TaxID=106590 RepID=UPI003FA489A3
MRVPTMLRALLFDEQPDGTGVSGLDYHLVVVCRLARGAPWVPSAAAMYCP